MQSYTIEQPINNEPAVAFLGSIEYNIPAIYGNFVSCDTPVIIKHKDRIVIIRIDQFVTADIEDENIDDKIQTSDVQIWTESGFTKLKNVTRRKTSKHMYRICTSTGIVDVTEDHTCLLANGKKVHTKDLHIDATLLQEDIPETEFVYNDCCMTTYESSVIGKFIGDMVYKLSDKERSVIMKYKRDIYNERDECLRIPSCMLNTSKTILTYFWDAYVKVSNSSSTPYICEGKELVAGLYIIGTRLGYQVNITVHDTYTNTYRLKCLNVVPTDHVISITDLGTTSAYVYELDTQNHHAHVGPGNLILQSIE
jgi:hypothetical protein